MNHPSSCSSLFNIFKALGWEGAPFCIKISMQILFGEQLGSRGLRRLSGFLVQMQSFRTIICGWETYQRRTMTISGQRCRVPRLWSKREKIAGQVFTTTELLRWLKSTVRNVCPIVNISLMNYLVQGVDRHTNYFCHLSVSHSPGISF